MSSSDGFSCSEVMFLSALARSGSGQTERVQVTLGDSSEATRTGVFDRPPAQRREPVAITQQLDHPLLELLWRYVAGNLLGRIRRQLPRPAVIAHHGGKAVGQTVSDQRRGLIVRDSSQLDGQVGRP